ncbi:MAG: ribonuclease HI family protein [Candidatus Eiseniibacteriota bacterium]
MNDRAGRPGTDARRALVLHTDGASRGNPGLAGAGAVLFGDGGEILAERCRFLGLATNNEAEYAALILGLELALEHHPAHLTVRMDSELIVRQLGGRYRVRNARLLPLFERARELLGELPGSTIEHVDRELNADADRLANRAIDRAARAPGRLDGGDPAGSGSDA